MAKRWRIRRKRFDVSKMPATNFAGHERDIEQGFCRTYHNETVADPQFAPTGRTLGYGHGLAVHGDHPGRGLAHGTPEQTTSVRLESSVVESVVNGGEESDFTPAVHQPRYVFGNVRAQDRRHHQRHRFGRAQPVAVIVPARVVAHFVQVAEQERHGVELFQTTARRTYSKRPRKHDVTRVRTAVTGVRLPNTTARYRC